MGRRFTLVTLVSLASVAACAKHYPPPAAAIPPSFDKTITATRIGPVSLGMTEADLLKYLGKPTSSRFATATSVQASYDGYGIVAGIHDGIVDQLSTGDPSYSTDTGLHVGSDQLELRAHRPTTSAVYEKTSVVPAPASVTEYRFHQDCPHSGTPCVSMHVGVGADGRVMSIQLLSYRH